MSSCFWWWWSGGGSGDGGGGDGGGGGARGVLPILAYRGRLRPKGVPFSGFRSGVPNDHF